MSSFTATDLVNAKIEAIKEFMALMAERFDIIEEIKELAEEFKGKLEDDKPLNPKVSKPIKEMNEGEKKVRKPRTKKVVAVDSEGEPKVVKKRGPSLYNIFVKEHMTMFKDVDSKARMTEIGVFWKTSEKGKFFTERQKEIKVNKPSLNSQEIYDMISNEWDVSVSSGDEEATVVSM